MSEILRLDPGDMLSIVNNFSPWLDQSVKHNVAIVVDDGHTCQSVSFLGQDSLTVNRKDLSLSEQNKKIWC